ncbi:MAG: DUF4105 domain-containing protein [Bdellovibrionales bacterium]|nr:DUF4105 domain-containing protein [Bdellovibrionales bacterium]
MVGKGLFILILVTGFFPALAQISFSERGLPFDTFAKELKDIIPKSLLKQVPEVEFIKGSQNDFSPILFGDCFSVSHNPKNWFDRKRGRIIAVNPHLYSIIQNGFLAKLSSCRHRTQYEYALATFIYQLSLYVDKKRFFPREKKFYELNCRVFDSETTSNNLECDRLHQKKWMYSDDPKFLVLNFNSDIYDLDWSDQDRRLWLGKDSVFSVYMEYFLLDPEFSCRFPLMSSYLLTHFSDTIISPSCIHEERVESRSSQEEFLLSAESVQEVQFVLVGPGNELSSRWGHVMLLVKDLRNKNYVFSYYGDGQSGFSVIGGMTGAMWAQPYLYEAEERITHYKKLGQSLTFYPLKLTRLQVERLIHQILVALRSHRGTWNHLTNNCVVNTLRLLQAAMMFDRDEVMELKSHFPRSLVSDLVQLRIISESYH